MALYTAQVRRLLERGHLEQYNGVLDGEKDC